MTQKILGQSGPNIRPRFLESISKRLSAAWEDYRRRAPKAAKPTQKALADAMKISRSHLNNILAGRESTDAIALKRAAKFLGVEMEWLHEGKVVWKRKNGSDGTAPESVLAPFRVLSRAQYFISSIGDALGLENRDGPSTHSTCLFMRFGIAHPSITPESWISESARLRSLPIGALFKDIIGKPPKNFASTYVILCAESGRKRSVTLADHSVRWLHAAALTGESVVLPESIRNELLDVGPTLKVTVSVSTAPAPSSSAPRP